MPYLNRGSGILGLGIGNPYIFYPWVQRRFKGKRETAGIGQGWFKGYRRFLRGFTMGRIPTNRRPESTRYVVGHNIQDTINLENLIVTAYNMKLKETPFYESHLIEEPTLPGNPLRADLGTEDNIKKQTTTLAPGSVVLTSCIQPFCTMQRARVFFVLIYLWNNINCRLKVLAVGSLDQMELSSSVRSVKTGYQQLDFPQKSRHSARIRPTG